MAKIKTSSTCKKPGWETDPDKKKFIRDIVHEVISLFVAKRCMIGSTF